MQYLQEFFHEGMAYCSDPFRFFRIHFILQQKQLVIEVLQRIFDLPSVPAAEGKSPCDPDRADGIQPVCVLDDLSFQGLRASAAVFAERDGIDDCADLLDYFLFDILFLQERPGIGVILCME